jgi:restriction system protein
MSRKGPKFLRFFIPLLDSLKELGGSGTVSEVIDLVIERMEIPEKEQEETLKSGGGRVRNQIQWARFYLAKAGLLGSSRRGVWSLTEKGLKAKLTDDDVYPMFKAVQAEFREEAESREKSEPVEATAKARGTEVDELDWQRELLAILQALPPAGFERICQRLLRESGFQRVRVTGRSRDGGIDGQGILELNPFVSFDVLFQCKRYQGSISPSQVRDFRGAMMGRADKGIIMTTGTFTLEAKKEARRDGVPPIELVDGEKLVEMFEKLELGMKPKQVYEIDPAFFEEFKV